MPSNPIGHPGPGGPPPPNSYRPQGMPPAMSPSMNQTGPRSYMTNSPGVNSIFKQYLFFIFFHIYRWEVILHHHLFLTVYVYK
jgi:hypothetical protein